MDYPNSPKGSSVSPAARRAVNNIDRKENFSFFSFDYSSKFTSQKVETLKPIVTLLVILLKLFISL